MKKGLCFGILIVLIGVVFLLNAVGAIHFQFDTWWPLILIVIGLPVLIVGPGRFFALILVYLGGWFLCEKNGWLPTNMAGLFWPILIILFGIAVIYSVIRRKNKKEDKREKFECAGSFCEVDMKNTSEAFKEGKASAVFGAVKLDLSSAHAESSEVKLTLEAVFGALEVVVPKDWEVHVSGALVLGAIQNKSSFQPAEKKVTANANCSGFMGAITIRN
ncbi:MAG: DUF5668 domain-containing protein [Bacillota bacterium]|nr:DUF5668 domain-containing protein [Bacillota bacterium]